MDTTILNENGSGGLPEGDPLSSVLTFSDSPGSSSSSSMGDFTPQLSCSLKASSTRSSIGTVAHRPWEDGIPCGPRWLQSPCYDSMMSPFSGKPKTFKPVLLYHRPEEPDFRYLPRFRPYCSHVPFPAYEGDDDAYCVFCQEDAEENMRDLLHSTAVHDHLCMMGHALCETGHHDCPDCNCSCGFQNPLVSRKHSLGSMKPSAASWYSLMRSGRAIENLGQHCDGPCSLANDAFPYPFSIPQFPTFLPQNPLRGSPQLPFPVSQRTRSHSGPHRSKNHTIPRKIPYSAGSPATNPARTSFAMSPENRYSMTQQPPKPYFPMLTRHPDTLDRGSANEIRRALLMNHPVFGDSCSACTNSNTNFTGFHDKQCRLGGAHNIGFDDNHRARLGSDPTKAGTNISHNHDQIHASKPGICTVSSEIVPNLSQCSSVAPSGTNPGQPPPSMPQYSSLNSFVPEGTDGWQEWAGKYGSFLQLLNSPECPCPGDSNSPSLHSLVSEPPAKRFMGPGPTSLDLAGLGEQTTNPGVSTSAEEAGDNAEDREDKRHKCPYCDVACTNNGQLKGHLRVHTGERPYRCECGRAFARNEELTRHRRIHSGLRPHLCTTCGKRFGRKDHLNKHQKTHLRTSEKKTHACRVEGCQQRYTRSDALARHQWGAHGIKAKTSRIRPAAPPAAPHNDLNAEPAGSTTAQQTQKLGGLDNQHNTDAACVRLFLGLSPDMEQISSM